MPTYQYACTNPDCGNRFELVQSFTDPAASSCPVCGSPVRKVYGSVGVVFKGPGFYRTDSRSGNGKAETSSTTAAKSETSSSKSESTSGSAKSDSSSSASTGSGSGSGKVAASA